MNNTLIKTPKLARAVELVKSGRKLLFHSSISKYSDEIEKYGLEPTSNGPWIKEIAMSAYDDDADIDEELERAVPIVWLSDDPTWTFMKVKRAAGSVTLDNFLKYGHLAIIDAEEASESANLYYIGDDGLNNGAYSTVLDINGKPVKFFDTDLYKFDDERMTDIIPFGIERNEWVSADVVDVAVSLTGEDLLYFYHICYPNLMSKISN